MHRFLIVRLRFFFRSLPLRVLTSPLLSIDANDAAKDGFSATIKTLFIFDTKLLILFLPNTELIIRFDFSLLLMSICLS